MNTSAPVFPVERPHHATTPEVLSAFSILRGRMVLGQILLAAIGTTVPFVVGGRILFGRGYDFASPLLSAVIEIAFYCLLMLLLHRLLGRSGLHSSVLMGNSVDWRTVRRFWFLPVLLAGTTLAGLLLVFYPLSFVAGPFVDSWLLRARPPLVNTSGAYFSLVNCLNLIVMVGIGPVVEEFTFRGILLTRWSVKWGTPRAILLSSIIFGVLHTEMLGHVFFGYVMAILYIQSRSLYVPMIFHGVNNLFVWLATLKGPGADKPLQQGIAEFQSAWPAVLVVLAIFIPWAIWFLRRHFPRASWKPPSFEVLRR